jgi:hypothetical protein
LTPGDGSTFHSERRQTGILPQVSSASNL